MSVLGAVAFVATGCSEDGGGETSGADATEQFCGLVRQVTSSTEMADVRDALLKLQLTEEPPGFTEDAANGIDALVTLSADRIRKDNFQRAITRLPPESMRNVTALDAYAITACGSVVAGAAVAPTSAPPTPVPSDELPPGAITELPTDLPTDIFPGLTDLPTGTRAPGTERPEGIPSDLVSDWATMYDDQP